MKKVFLAIAAIAMSVAVNAQTVSFADIVDNTSADLAKSTATNALDATNVKIDSDVNSSGDSYYATLTQVAATTDWVTTVFSLKESAANVKFSFKNNNADKLIAKWYSDYIQPNGKGLCLEISGLNVGDKVTLNIKKALNKEAMIEGATVATDMFASTSVVLEAAAETIKVYSNNTANDADAKWQLQSVIIGDASGVENASADAKEVKYFNVNGQEVAADAKGFVFGTDRSKKFNK